MSSACFVSQEATADILMRVSSFCAECYRELNEGETIHYDMQSYRYLCTCCQEKLCSSMNEACEVVREVEEGLFC